MDDTDKTVSGYVVSSESPSFDRSLSATSTADTESVATSSPGEDLTEHARKIRQVTKGNQEPSGHVSASQRTLAARPIRSAISSGLQQGAVTSSSSPESQNIPLVPHEYPPSWPINENTKAELVAVYLSEVSLWFELTDTPRYFSTQNAKHLFESQLFAGAALSVAALRDEAKKRRPYSTSKILYSFTRKILIWLDQWHDDSIFVASTLFLCIYAMMTQQDDSHLHFSACIGIVKEKGWTGSVPGLAGAAFWGVVRLGLYFL